LPLPLHLHLQELALLGHLRCRGATTGTEVGLVEYRTVIMVCTAAGVPPATTVILGACTPGATGQYHKCVLVSRLH
jgi:hypothetical protein